MARRKRSDAATAGDCSWGFLNEPLWARDLRVAARLVAQSWDWVEEGDIHQELMIYYGVRPEVTATPPGRGLVLKRASEIAGVLHRRRGDAIGYTDAGLE